MKKKQPEHQKLQSTSVSNDLDYTMRKSKYLYKVIKLPSQCKWVTNVSMNGKNFTPNITPQS